MQHKLNETITHTLTTKEYLAKLRQRSGLIFKIGDAVTVLPLKATAAAVEVVEPPEHVKQEAARLKALFEGIGIPTSVEVRRVQDHEVECPILADPHRLHLVYGFEGDGVVSIVTLDDDGNLIEHGVPAERLNPWHQFGTTNAASDTKAA